MGAPMGGVMAVAPVVGDGVVARKAEKEVEFGKGDKASEPDKVGGAAESGMQAGPFDSAGTLRESIVQLLSYNPFSEFSLSSISHVVHQCMLMCCKPSSMAKESSSTVVGLDALASPGMSGSVLEVWESTVLLALGHLAGRDFSKPCGSLDGPAMKKSVAQQLKRFDMWEEKCGDDTFEKFFSTKSIGYSGDEIKLAKPLMWKAVSDSLPRGVGELDLEEFCTLGTREFVQDFERFLLPVEEQVRMKPPKVMLVEEDWPLLVEGLVQRNICKIMPVDQLYHINNEPLLNGLFGIGKNEYVDSVETQRLIMNLTPVNSLVRELQGDVGTLPSLQNFGQLFLGEDEQLLVSSEDVRCFFYLFRTPPCWHKYMGFNKLLPREMVPDEYAGRDCVLCATVLPMGFQASVSIAQHVHRNVVRQALTSMTPAVGAEGEIRKDMGFPQTNDRYRIYLDNFDQLEVADMELAEKIKGSCSSLVEELRQTYQRLGIPRHPKKSVSRQCRAEVQGSLVLGDMGIAIAKPQKVLQYMGMAISLLKKGESNLKEMQVVCGGFVYLTTFRRELLSGLNHVWHFMEHLKMYPPVVRLPMPDQVVGAGPVLVTGALGPDIL